ncbi:MAG: T9SS type A sorting domain-containing protein, partial [Bacteroidota bacterium]
TLSGVFSSSGSQLIYSWSTTNGNILSGETELQAVVDQSGTYTFSVLDTETGCLTSDEVQITFATGFELELDTRIDILCQGDATGSLSVRPLQGVPPFIYNWSNGASTAQNDNLNAGTYTVTVTDANACSNVFTTTLNEPSAILVDISATAESEAGANDGQAQAIVTGGVSPFSFQWSNGENSARIVDLAPDTYSVTITDANGCTTIASTTVNAADCSLSTISLTANPVSCFGGGDGSASIIVNGGLPPYDYNWSNGTDTQENINLIAGNYGLTVTDQGGCTIETNINITQPEDLVITTSESTNPKCNSDGDGTATVAVTGGTGNYRFQWSSGSQDSVATNLFAGTYTVTVFDDNNCTITTNITITEPTALSADITTTDETTVNGMDGTVSVTPTGGTSPYRYEWSTGATTSTLDNLAAGTYGLTIFDGQNCSLSTTVNINTVNCSDFVVNLQGIAPTCIDRMDGQVVVAGDAPDGLMLDIADELLDQLAAGDYNVTATDERGCSSTQLVTVPTADTLTITIVEITPATNNDATGSIVIEVEGMGENISYGWVNSMGTVVSNEQNPANLLPDTYSLQVVYNADCVQILTNIIVDNVTNTETIASSTQFDIFPNPTADLLQVEIHHAQPAIINWVLLDYLGKTSRKNTEAIKQKRFTIDTASLPTGVYWLNIQIAEQWIVQKVVKL